jgi:hypothetical protein
MIMRLGAFFYTRGAAQGRLSHGPSDRGVLRKELLGLFIDKTQVAPIKEFLHRLWGIA